MGLLRSRPPSHARAHLKQALLRGNQAYETLKARGVEFVHEPQIIHSTDTYELWMAFFRDLDENLLAVMAEVGK